MRVLAIIAWVCLAGPALALSCMRPDAVRDFLEADASSDVWIVVDGTLQFDQAALPPRAPLNNDAPPTTDISARMTGKSLSENGFARDFDSTITLRIQCFGPWCGGAQDGQRYLAFLKRENSGYVMLANPCGSRIYPDASDRLRRTLTRCMRGQTCVPGKQQR